MNSEWLKQNQRYQCKVNDFDGQRDGNKTNKYKWAYVMCMCMLCIQCLFIHNYACKYDVNVFISYSVH